jgi:hypothetical protein
LLATFVNQWIGSELAANPRNSSGAEHFAHCRPAKVSDRIGSEQPGADLPDWFWRKIDGSASMEFGLPHSQSRASRGADRGERRFVFTHNRPPHRRLAHSPATRECRCIELNVSRKIPGTVDSEVHVERIPAIKGDKQVFSDGIGVRDEVPVEYHAIAETALRACDCCRVSNKMLPKLSSDAVNRVAFGHT